MKKRLGVALNTVKKGEIVEVKLDPEVVKAAGITLLDTNEEAAEKLRAYIKEISE